MINDDYKLSCLKKYGKNSISFLTLINNLPTYTGNWEGYISYYYCARTAVVLGDPIVPFESLRTAIKDFKQSFSQRGIHICIFSCTKKIIDTLEKENFKGIYIGSEAVVDLNKFNISGNKNWKIRSSVNYARKKNMIVEEYNPYFSKSRCIENEIKNVSENWCKMKMIPKPEFMLGKNDFTKSYNTRYFICKHDNKTLGYINYYPILSKNDLYLDHARRDMNSPRGIIDFLMVESFKKLRDEGIKKVYIGLSPFSFFSSEYKLDSIIDNNLFNFSKHLFKLFYPTKSEFFFKNKYATEWEPNYLYFHPKYSMRMIISLANSFYAGGFLALLLKKTRYFLGKKREKSIGFRLFGVVV